jgi:hypothetical protein
MGLSRVIWLANAENAANAASNMILNASGVSSLREGTRLHAVTTSGTSSGKSSEYIFSPYNFAAFRQSATSASYAAVNTSICAVKRFVETSMIASPLAGKADIPQPETEGRTESKSQGYFAKHDRQAKHNALKSRSR